MLTNLELRLIHNGGADNRRAEAAGGPAEAAAGAGMGLEAAGEADGGNGQEMAPAGEPALGGV